MKHNDEPTHHDYDKLGHKQFAESLGKRLLNCSPPYVWGICGSWGSGKTSFLKKLKNFLETTKLKPREGDSKQDAKKDLHLIWFNPWHHQFESNPLVALLQEIRHHFTIKRKLYDETGKLISLATFAALDSVLELGKGIGLSLPNSKTIREQGREYEADHLATKLGSQRFRQAFEQSIDIATNKKGKVYIFIDDLDRCEAETAYRLLEALKLYLNVNNCVFILGLDREHLEINIAKVLSGEKDSWNYRPLARDYLDKMFQHLFILPNPRNVEDFIWSLFEIGLGELDLPFAGENLFGWNLNPDGAGPDALVPQEEIVSQLVGAFSKNLPPNPRKLKSFITSWRMYLETLTPRKHGDVKLDWRLTVVLHYLAQFEEPLYRQIEISPAFYNDQVVRFCLGMPFDDSFFRGLRLPYEMGSSFSESSPEDQKATEKLPPRRFWIAPLVKELADPAQFGVEIPVPTLYRHLPYAGSEIRL